MTRASHPIFHSHSIGSDAPPIQRANAETTTPLIHSLSPSDYRNANIKTAATDHKDLTLTDIQKDKDTLTNKESSEQERAKAASELYESGIKEFKYKDKNGVEHNYKLEEETKDGKKGIKVSDGAEVLFEAIQDERGNWILVPRAGGAGGGASHSEGGGARQAGGARGGGRDGGGHGGGGGGGGGDGGGGGGRVGGGGGGRGGASDGGVVPTLDQLTGGKSPEGTTGSIDRSQFKQQLNNPDVMAAFAGRMAKEVGSQGPAAQLAFAEEVMNRAAARGQTLMQALTGSYYPTNEPGRSSNPALIAAITTAFQEGTDTTHGATGNASGTVGFGKGGVQTVAKNGEKFGWEAKDLKNGWLDKYQSLKA